MPLASPPDPLITVVIPVWGIYCELLPAALASLQRQGVPLTILVVDNQHPAQPLPSLPGVTVIRTPVRHTLGDARNFGLSQVTTPFVFFLDADDTLLPGILEVLLAPLQRSPRYVAVAARFLQPETLTPYHWPWWWAFPLNHSPRLFALAECHRAIFPLNLTLIRTTVLRSTPGFDPDPASAEDWVLGASLVSRGPVLLLKSTGLFYTQRHSEPTTFLARWRRQFHQSRAIRRRLSRDPITPTYLRRALPWLFVFHQVDSFFRAWRPYTPTSATPRNKPTPNSAQENF